MLEDLDNELNQALERVMRFHGCNRREALRQALATEIYIQEHRGLGYSVLLENGKEIKEVIFR